MRSIFVLKSRLFNSSSRRWLEDVFLTQAMEGLTWYVSDYQWNQRQTLQLAPIRNAHILVDKNEVGSVPHKINKNIMYARMGESFSFSGGVWRGEKCLFFSQATTTSSHLKKLEIFHSALRRLKLESWKGRMEIFYVLMPFVFHEMKETNTLLPGFAWAS